MRDDDAIRGPPPVAPIRWPRREEPREGQEERQPKRESGRGKSEGGKGDRRGRWFDDYA